jgi:hypothetical protein
MNTGAFAFPTGVSHLTPAEVAKEYNQRRLVSEIPPRIGSLTINELLSRVCR